MLQKVRTLRKKIKEKEVQSKPEKIEITNITTSKVQQKASEEIKKRQQQLLLQPPTKRRDSYIDPLEYFQKEHIIKDENNIMDEIFGEEKAEFEENGGKKEEQKTKTKPKGGMMMMGMPMPMGGMPGMGFRINFEEMMKVRAKIKKEPEKKPERPASVQSRPVQKKLEDEEDNDAEPQIKAGHEQNLYIKLVLARNKFNELSSSKTNNYKKIKDQIQALRQIKDLPPKYNEKVDEYESRLKVPELLILDPDLQFIDDNKEYGKIIKTPLALDEIITSLNVNGK
jgi:hypothetical protein